jgi:dienelactone hydrolase
MTTTVHVGRARAAALFAALVMALAAVTAGLAGTSPAGAQTNPYERGPDPTNASIEASRGPYSVSTTSVSSFSAPGFGGGTIYYPTTTSDGTFGAVAISPGYTASQSSISWMGPRYASQGFVVITIDTNSRYDQPGSRADQLQAALDYLVEDSSVRTRIDPDRLAVAGHSMGGGGTIEAAADNPALQAAVAYQPWHTDKTWGEMRVPTMIQGAESDSIASVSSHSIPFYNSIPASAEKAYVEMNNASHFVSNSSHTPTAKYTIAWLKRFVDDDARYEQFLCPGPSTGSSISEYENTCPYGGSGGGGTTTTTTTPPTTECAWWQWWC